MKLFLLLLALSVSAFAADVVQLKAVSSNASELYASITKTAQAFKWVLGVIPGIVTIWGLHGTFKTYRKFKTADNNSSHAGSLLDELGAIAFNYGFAMLSIFLIYGIFVKVYADPNGSKTFLDAWKMLVFDFWKGMLTHS